MPEGPEVKIASDFFNDFFDKSLDIKFEIISEYYNDKYSNVFKSIAKNMSPGFTPSFTIGKNIFINLKNKKLFNFHLGMTGGWSKTLTKHCHFRIYNKNQELFFLDIRKFGKMKIIGKSYFTKNFNRHYDLLNKSYNFQKHYKYLEENISKNRSICSVIMDQKKFPGVGNYIKSESLYKSKIHPETKWGNLSKNTKQKIILNIRNVMQESYVLGGAELKNFSNPFQKSKFYLEVYGKKITKNNNPIKSIKTSDQRKSWLCPIEQPLNVK